MTGNSFIFKLDGLIFLCFQIFILTVQENFKNSNPLSNTINQQMFPMTNRSSLFGHHCQLPDQKVFYHHLPTSVLPCYLIL